MYYDSNQMLNNSIVNKYEDTISNFILINTIKSILKSLSVLEELLFID